MRARPWIAWSLALALAGCGSGDGTTDPGATDPGTPDVPTADPGTDPGTDVGTDTAPEAGTDVPADTADPGTDAPPPACQDGQAKCSEDGYRALACTAGTWVESRACLRDEGRLCEAGACVDPWRYGSPAWSDCAGDPKATPETLAQKATSYDAIARRLHIHPQLKWASNLTLKATASEATATYDDVEAWHTGENDGLWSALYLASQAFRYAVTKSPEALDTIRLLLEGEVQRMKITGVPGVFTRQLIPPGVPGIACPTDDGSYTTDVEKDDNRWVQVREDGCQWVVDHTTGQWTKTPSTLATPGARCGLDEFKGWCWLDNVSQDEYAGHMLALGAIWKLVDDPGVKATAADLLAQVADHLRTHWLMITDWDGRITEHGKLHALSVADSPGFLSTMSMDYVLMGAVASGRQDLRAFYDECLLQTKGEACPGNPWDFEAEYTEYIPQMLLYVGPDGCKSNFNNFSMVLTSLHNLIWFERDPAIRELVQDTFDRHFMHEEGQTRLVIDQLNAWFNFTYAAQKRLGPGSDGPAYQPVRDAVCALRQFPASKAARSRDTESLAPEYCEGRLGGSEAEKPFPIADRCLGTFSWWGDPYEREKCSANPQVILQPGDYLLPYWMGRYYGFLPETL